MRQVITPTILGKGVTAFFTGKNPGVDPDAVAGLASVTKTHLFLPIQKHTDRVLIIDGNLEPKIADAVITRRRDVLIGVQAADCVPILLHDHKAGIIGAVHAGWRGTAESILMKTISQMVERFSSAPEDITVAIGPSIRQCCYEVGHDVAEAVERASACSCSQRRGEKRLLDLTAANSSQARAAGIPSGNVAVYGECTFCNPERYYSYRFAKGPSGRQGGFIRLL